MRHCHLVGLQDIFDEPFAISCGPRYGDAVGLDGSWRRAEAGRCSNAAYADFDPSSPAECKDPLAAAASTLFIAFVMNAHLVEALHCMAQASPIAVIGETIWGDEVGAVYVLQMQRSVQHLADSFAAFRSYVQRTPQLLIDSLSSELYAAASIATDASPEHPLYIELTSTILPSRKFASATFVSAHTRYAEQRARAQQGQMVWLQGLGVSQFKALEVWAHSGTSALPPCSNEKFNGDMDAALDDLCSTKGDGGKSIICQNCTQWLQ